MVIIVSGKAKQNEKNYFLRGAKSAFYFFSKKSLTRKKKTIW